MKSSQIVPTGDSILCTGERHGSVLHCTVVKRTEGYNLEVGEEFLVFHGDAHWVGMVDNPGGTSYDIALVPRFYLVRASSILAIIKPET